jgi:hypothetical protein
MSSIGLELKMRASSGVPGGVAMVASTPRASSVVPMTK